MENETVKELLELQKLKSEFDFLLIQLRSEMKKREPIINLNFARKYNLQSNSKLLTLISFVLESENKGKSKIE